MQAAATSRTGYRPSLLKKLIKYRHTYILLFPFMLVFTVFTIWPVVLSLFISFTNFNVFESPSFVGWNNYVNLFVNCPEKHPGVRRAYRPAGLPVVHVFCLGNQ